MPLQSSGSISLGRIHGEANNISGTLTTQVSINDTDVRALINKSSLAESDFSDFYGADGSGGGGGGGLEP
jgi:hypothetical protein